MGQRKKYISQNKQVQELTCYRGTNESRQTLTKDDDTEWVRKFIDTQQIYDDYRSQRHKRSWKKNTYKKILMYNINGAANQLFLK